MARRWLKKLNNDGETEFHAVPKLYSACTQEMFGAAPFSRIYSNRKRTVKIDRKNHRVLLNDQGTCTVQQFGTLDQANETYKRLEDWVRHV